MTWAAGLGAGFVFAAAMPILISGGPVCIHVNKCYLRNPTNNFWLLVLAQAVLLQPWLLQLRALARQPSTISYERQSTSPM